MKTIVKIGLALLLLGCLASMPYGYFMLVRYLAMVGFAYFAFEAYKEENKTMVFVYIALAILFQPLSKIHLGRTLWNIVDVMVAVGLLGSLVNRNKN